MDTATLISQQHRHFQSGATLPLSYRIDALDRLKAGIYRFLPEIESSLQSDLGKHPYESYLCEVGQVLRELSFIRSHLRRWVSPHSVPTPFTLFPAKSKRFPQPYGVALIMAPWNYPFMLSLTPVIGALAAGNCVVLKPSDYAPATSKVLTRLISHCFDSCHVSVVEGGKQEADTLLNQHVDYIFFTGGVSVGREVMRKAANHLTPITLELGGKSPCIVDSSANLSLAAKRIVFGKFLNAGQTCVAPDYILVQKDVKQQLVRHIRLATQALLGKDPLSSPEYGSIVNETHFHRLLHLLDGQSILMGGQTAGNKIAPTLLDNVSPNSPLMQEEIFGPILPILEYTEIEQAIDFIATRESPLALYLFSRNTAVQRDVLTKLSFGGGCVNDTILHLTNPYMPFGGIGQSGMGRYHGKASFDTFTHYKSILFGSQHIDIPLRYHPYTPFKDRLLRKFLK